MPLWIGDYLGDTQRLTTEQHGAYLLLIIDYWRNGPPPDDDDVLRHITRLDLKQWRQHRRAISALFRIDDGVWHHKRIDAELERAKNNASRRSDKASKAAKARWGDAQSNAPSMPEALPVECPPPSPSPSPSEDGKEITPLHAFSGKIIRLNARDFASWEQRYSAISDIRAELGALDDWLQGQDDQVRGRWFHVVSGALNKKHQAGLAEARDSSGAEFLSPC